MQGIFTITVANMIVLVPMVLNGHPGTKYGIPFPVLARASFGVRGANIPSIMRGLVACGGFGIQTWIGGQAIFTLLNSGSTRWALMLVVKMFIILKSISFTCEYTYGGIHINAVVWSCAHGHSLRNQTMLARVKI